jgi:hypothetical protein
MIDLSAKPTKEIQMAKSNRPATFALNYLHSVTVVHAGGAAVTTVGGNESLNTWTRKTTRTIEGVRVGPGVTVKPDYKKSIRFEGVVAVSDNRA